MYMCGYVQVPAEARVGFPGTRVSDTCGQPNVGTRN